VTSNPSLARKEGRGAFQSLESPAEGEGEDIQEIGKRHVHPGGKRGEAKGVRKKRKALS